MGQTNHLRKRFSFISDPSHGWLIVTPAELRTVGITEDDITPYSYRNVAGELIALEEDYDAHAFLRKWEAMIGQPAEIEDAVEGLKSSKPSSMLMMSFHLQHRRLQRIGIVTLLRPTDGGSQSTKILQ